MKSCSLWSTHNLQKDEDEPIRKINRKNKTESAFFNEIKLSF